MDSWQTGRALLYTKTIRRDCKLSVNSADVTAAYSLCEKLPYLGCSDEFLQLATLIMRDSNLSMPVTAQEGKELFKYVINEIEELQVYNIQVICKYDLCHY